MHLLSSIWSDVSVMEMESHRERGRERDRDWERAGREEGENKWPAMHTTYTLVWSSKQTKNHNASQSWYETRTGFHQIGSYSNPRMDSCFTKRFEFPNCTPLRQHFCVG